MGRGGRLARVGDAVQHHTASGGGCGNVGARPEVAGRQVAQIQAAIDDGNSGAGTAGTCGDGSRLADEAQIADRGWSQRCIFVDSAHAWQRLHPPQGSQ